MRRLTTLCTALTLGLVTGAVAVVVAGAGPAHACSCMALTDKQAFRRADVVFTGGLTGTELTNEGPVYSTGDLERFFFDVDTVFKGTATDQQTILTARDGASCGLEIGGPGPFVVYAYRERAGSDKLSSNLCSGTRPLSYGELPASFGDGRPPTSPPAEEDDAAWFEAVMSIWVTVMFPVAALFLSPAS